MITRSVEVLFKNGMCVKLALPPHEGSELDSTKEFIDKIKVYRDAIQRFIVRNPNLELGKKEKEVENLTDFFHVLLNARKYVDLKRIMVPEQQHFVLDFVSGCFSVYKMDTSVVVGTMYFNAMYDNWEELFYPRSPIKVADHKISVTTILADGSLTTKDIEDIDSIEKYLAESESSKPVKTEEPTSDVDFNPSRDLSSAQYELHKFLFKYREYKGTVRIGYSGAGDSGCTDSVVLHNSITEKIDLMDEEIDRLIWNVISEEEDGFYNNDGGYGTMEISRFGFKWKHFNYVTDEDQTVDQTYGNTCIPDHVGGEDDDDEDYEEDYEEEEDHPDHYAKHGDPTDYKDEEYDKHADDPSPELPF